MGVGLPARVHDFRKTDCLHEKWSELLYFGANPRPPESELSYYGQAVAQGQHDGRYAPVIADFEAELAHQLCRIVICLLIGDGPSAENDIEHNDTLGTDLLQARFILQ